MTNCKLLIFELKKKKKQREGQEKSVGDPSGRKSWVPCAGRTRAGPRAARPPAPLLGPGANRGPGPRSFASARRGTRSTRRSGGETPPASAGSTLPSVSPSPPRSPEGNRQGAARRHGVGGGGVLLSEKSSAAQSGGRGLLINSASAQAPYRGVRRIGRA